MAGLLASLGAGKGLRGRREGRKKGYWVEPEPTPVLRAGKLVLCGSSECYLERTGFIPPPFFPKELEYEELAEFTLSNGN